MAVIARLVLIWMMVWPSVAFGLWAIEAAFPMLASLPRIMLLAAILVPAISLAIAPFAGWVVTRLFSAAE
ncbi:MAG: hypothetical protein MK010_04215 [Erythrobacter sp.]|nr:hypothetical protein [Erythrobacter sp.]